MLEPQCEGTCICVIYDDSYKGLLWLEEVLNGDVLRECFVGLLFHHISFNSHIFPYSSRKDKAFQSEINQESSKCNIILY
jgi:hypothetical protein